MHTEDCIHDKTRHISPKKEAENKIPEELKPRRKKTKRADTRNEKLVVYKKAYENFKKYILRGTQNIMKNSIY